MLPIVYLLIIVVSAQEWDELASLELAQKQLQEISILNSFFANQIKKQINSNMRPGIRGYITLTNQNIRQNIPDNNPVSSNMPEGTHNRNDRNYNTPTNNEMNENQMKQYGPANTNRNGRNHNEKETPEIENKPNSYSRSENQHDKVYERITKQPREIRVGHRENMNKEGQNRDNNKNNNNNDGKPQMTNDGQWVWNDDDVTSTEKPQTTKVVDLDDRAAFAGDECPPPKKKIANKCVELD